MKFVIEDLRKESDRRKLPAVRMEIDYELMTLYDAMQANDKVQIIKSKEKLKQLRLQFSALTHNQ